MIDQSEPRQQPKCSNNIFHLLFPNSGTLFKLVLAVYMSVILTCQRCTVFSKKSAKKNMTGSLLKIRYTKLSSMMSTIYPSVIQRKISAVRARNLTP